MAMGRNVFLNMHKDDDFTYSLTTVVAEDDSNEIVNYFVFPRLGLAVPLRNGDLLAFNAREEHCISARCDGTRDAFCVSFYVSAATVAGNQRDLKEGISGKEEMVAAVVEEVVKRTRKLEGKGKK